MATGPSFTATVLTVTQTRPVRDDDGQFVLRRTYRFEYSDTGNNRRPGSLVMVGQEVVAINIGLRIV